VDHLVRGRGHGFGPQRFWRAGCGWWSPGTLAQGYRRPAEGLGDAHTSRDASSTPGGVHCDRRRTHRRESASCRERCKATRGPEHPRRCRCHQYRARPAGAVVDSWRPPRPPRSL